jgi:hypothetical protein
MRECYQNGSGVIEIVLEIFRNCSRIVIREHLMYQALSEFTRERWRGPRVAPRLKLMGFGCMGPRWASWAGRITSRLPPHLPCGESLAGRLGSASEGA